MNMPLMIIGAVYGSLFLTEAHGISLTQSSLVISMICVGTIIGSPLFGYFERILSKKFLMAAGSLLSIFVFLLITYGPLSAVYSLTALFILLGFFTSSQVLGYSLITESAEKELTGTSTSVAAVIIMGLPMLLGPLAGKVMDLMSLTNLETGITSFPLKSFQIAFLLFPIGFFISFALLTCIKEKAAPKYISI